MLLIHNASFCFDVRKKRDISVFIHNMLQKILMESVLRIHIKIKGLFSQKSRCKKQYLTGPNPYCVLTSLTSLAFVPLSLAHCYSCHWFGSFILDIAGIVPDVCSIILDTICSCSIIFDILSF